MAPSVQSAQANGANVQMAKQSSKPIATIKEITQKTSNGGSNDNSNGDARKITILRDAVQRSITTYRHDLGTSADEFLDSCTSIDQFFDCVAGIRLRQIPHNGSRWDKVLKWTEFFAAQVYCLSEEVGHFLAYHDRAAAIIWASCKSLLQVCIPFR